MRAVCPVIDRVIIDRRVDCSSASECGKILNHQLRVKGSGMIVVQLHPLLVRQVMTCFIVIIVIKHRHVISKPLLDFPRDGRLAAAGPAGYTDYNNVIFAHNVSLPSESQTKTTLLYKLSL